MGFDDRIRERECFRRSSLKVHLGFRKQCVPDCKRIIWKVASWIIISITLQYLCTLSPHWNSFRLAPSHNRKVNLPELIVATEWPTWLRKMTKVPLQYTKSQLFFYCQQRLARTQMVQPVERRSFHRVVHQSRKQNVIVSLSNLVSMETI